VPLAALAALLAALVAGASAPAHGLRAGAAVAAIDVAAGAPLAGWDERGTDARAEGVREPLEARAVALEGGGGRPRVAVVALDTFAAWPGLHDAVTTGAGDLALDALVVVATGTRSGADGGRPEVLRALGDAGGRALREAAQALEPARAGVGEGRAPGLSRHAASPGGLVDERVAIVRVDAADGGAIATLFAFAAQPAVLSAANRRLSPDYPRHARRRLEAVRGGVALWLPGAAAGQVPNYGGLARRRGDVEFEVGAATALGNSLGLVVAAAAPTIPTAEEVPLAVRSGRAGLPGPAALVALRVGGLRILFAPVAASAEVAAQLRARVGGELLLVSNAGASFGDLFAEAETASSPAAASPRLSAEVGAALLGAGAALLQALP
jgi:hypothetical protein